MVNKFKFTFREIKIVERPDGGKIQQASEVLHSEEAVCETVPAATKKAREIAAKKNFHVRSIHHGPSNEVYIYTTQPPKEVAPKARPGKRLSPKKRKQLKP